MVSRSMIYVCHLVGIVLIAVGLWWLAVDISDMSDYKLVVALAALTGLVINHFRWWRLGVMADSPELIQKFNYIFVSNYLVLLLLFILLSFKR